jgi:hypothetical protein
MTEHDYEKALKLLVAVEMDLRNYLNDPAEYQASYLEDTHCLITEALSLLRVDNYARDYDYFEMGENLEIDLDGGLSAINE